MDLLDEEVVKLFEEGIPSPRSPLPSAGGFGDLLDEPWDSVKVERVLDLSLSQPLEQKEAHGPDARLPANMTMGGQAAQAKKPRTYARQVSCAFDFGVFLLCSRAAVMQTARERVGWTGLGWAG